MRSALGGLNPSNPRGRKDIALRDLIFRNKVECLALELDFAPGDRSARAQQLGRDIDHLRPAIGADVGEAPHQSATDRDHFAARVVIIAEIMLLRLSIDFFQKKRLPPRFTLFPSTSS